MAPTGGGLVSSPAVTRMPPQASAMRGSNGLLAPRSPAAAAASPGLAGMSPTMARAMPQASSPMSSLGGTGPSGSAGISGASKDIGSRPVRQPSQGSSVGNVGPLGSGTSTGTGSAPGRQSYRTHAPPGAGARPTSAQSAQSSTAPPRPLSAQSGQSSASTQPAAKDLRRWTDEDLRRQIQLLEKGLKSASAGGAVAKAAAAGAKQVSPALKEPTAELASFNTSPGAPPPSATPPAVSMRQVGASPSGASSPMPGRPPEYTDQNELKPPPSTVVDPVVPEKLEAELSLKERQVVELRAQIARREKHLTGRGRMNVDGMELEHPDPERTGPPALGSGAVAPSPGTTAAAPSVGSAGGNSSSLERLASIGSVLGQRAAEGSTAGANTPNQKTSLPSTPGGRETAQLEGELAWIVRQMEGHRKQISEHQQKLSALEKRHAEIISSLSMHGLGGGRSPASTVAERLEVLDDGAVGYDAITTRLGRHKELLEAASGESLPRREGLDDQLGGSVASSTISGTVARAAEAARAERVTRPFYTQSHGRGSSRPTSAGSGTSAGSREVGSAAGSRTSRSGTGNPFAPKVGLDALGRGPRPSGSANGSAAGSGAGAHAVPPVASEDAGDDGIAGDLSNVWPGGPPGSEPPRSFGKSYEAERIVYLLTQFGMKRPLRVPFVPLDAAVDGEGRPYLHGALEVRLCLSDDGNRLMVRVGSGSSGAGGRVFEIEEFVNRAEAIEARRCQRPTPIAEEAVPQMEPLGDTALGGVGGSSFGGGATFGDSAEMPSLNSLLGRKDGDTSSGSLPWKKLFKAHWNS